MKKCSKCGALQSDDRNLCVDCGALLGVALTEDEAADAAAALSDTVEEMAERSEAFYVSPLARILGICSIVAAVVLTVFIALLAGFLNDLQSQLPEGVLVAQHSGGATTIVGTGDTQLTAEVERILRAEEAVQQVLLWALIGLFCFVMTALFFLIPRIMWYIGTLRYRLWFDGEPSPSALYHAVSSVITYSLFAIGIVCLVLTVWQGLSIL